MGQVVYPSGIRRFSRVTYHRPAVLDLKSARAECEVLDVSLKGALVEVGPGVRIKVGDGCSLLIHLDAGESLIRMDGEVAHVNGHKVGVKADEMELESVEHLRRLVEVNLGGDLKADMQIELAGKIGLALVTSLLEVVLILGIGVAAYGGRAGLMALANQRDGLPALAGTKG